MFLCWLRGWIWQAITVSLFDFLEKILSYCLLKHPFPSTYLHHRMGYRSLFRDGKGIYHSNIMTLARQWPATQLQKECRQNNTAWQFTEIFVNESRNKPIKTCFIIIHTLNLPTKAIPELLYPQNITFVVVPPFSSFVNILTRMQFWLSMIQTPF